MVSGEMQIVWCGKHLQVVRRGTWEYVTRQGTTGVVGIVAITEDRQIVLVEQYRPPLDARVIELPAGLVGDQVGQGQENMEEAALRELQEETGYAAGEMVRLVEGVSSAGLSDECITLFLARGLRKTGDGGGDGSEEITVHEVALTRIAEWLQERQREGCVVDLKIYAGIELASRMA